MRSIAKYFCGVSFLFLGIVRLVQAFPVTVGYAPQTSLKLLLHAVESARKTLQVNIYELTSPEIAAALIAKVKEGVRVEVLLEGQPVSGMKPEGRAIQKEIVKAMKRAKNGSHFYEMTAPLTPGVKRRYRYNHAKYMIIDGARILVGSENYSSTGHPAKVDALGNRGWEVLIENGTVLRPFQSAFDFDTKVKFGDVFELVDGVAGSSFPSDAEPAEWVTRNLNSLTSLMRYLDAAVANPTLNATQVATVFSPETSLSGLLKLIQSARSTLSIEQMSFPYEWTQLGANSPLFEAVIAAARRGVRVRVLLNDEGAFDFGEEGRVHKNTLTAKLLRALANKEGLPMDARIANTKKMGVSYIHNKGVLVDGALTLISSINWTENSVNNNRETAVVLKSPEIHQFYEKIFNWDWQQSAFTAGSDPVNRPIDPRAEVCPMAMVAKVSWGRLSNAAQPAVGIYSSYSNQNEDAIFHRVSRRSPQGGCVYFRESDLIRIGQGEPEQFLEIRTHVGDGLSAEPRRLFFWNARVQRNGVSGVLSVRMGLPGLLPKGNFEGKYSAQVWDALGVEEQIGNARVDLEELESRLEH